VSGRASIRRGGAGTGLDWAQEADGPGVGGFGFLALLEPKDDEREGRNED
jgi:hypothetical protein